jgi:hypothetical protein
MTRLGEEIAELDQILDRVRQLRDENHGHWSRIRAKYNAVADALDILVSVVREEGMPGQQELYEMEQAEHTEEFWEGVSYADQQ